MENDAGNRLDRLLPMGEIEWLFIITLGFLVKRPSGGMIHHARSPSARQGKMAAF